jgi:predicted amidohydrolase
LIVGLASPRIATGLEDGLDKVRRCLTEAAERGAAIVCFPEAYLPGLRGQDFEVAAWDRAQEERALAEVRREAKRLGVAVILGFERVSPDGRRIAAAVVDERGELLGVQTKVQLDPSEEPYYVAGSGRLVFEVRGMKFGIAICHEGWRYPETVRWAAVRGAKIVFHPQLTGSDRAGVVPERWGDPESPYYERAMMCRALENTIYFASVNYGLRFPESATSLIDPTGRCEAHLPYGEEGVLVHEIDLERATGRLASRFAPERYIEESGR